MEFTLNCVCVCVCVLRESTLQLFTLDQAAEQKLMPHSRLSLPHPSLDVTFDPEGRLWVLMDSSDTPLQIYTHRGGCWEVRRDSFSHCQTPPGFIDQTQKKTLNVIKT